MSFNLPANRLLRLVKGKWSDVHYPANVIVQANLSPRDYFEPVDRSATRSCIPAGGQNFSFLLDSNSGKMTLRGETMFPPLSVTFKINEDTWEIAFVGRCMQLSQQIGAAQELDSILTHFEHTLPALLALTTGLSVFVEQLEIAIGDSLEARSETLIPPSDVKVIDSDHRLVELQLGIEMLGLAMPSARFTLSCYYFRDALFFDAAYLDHNAYMHTLLVILKCAQAIEVLFGSKRDAIRAKCSSLGIATEIVESQIIPIVLARNSLGPAHASSFVPTPREADILRHFSKRSLHTVRQLLLYIGKVDLQKRGFLADKLERDRDKEKLLERVEESIKAAPWWAQEAGEVRHVLVPDPRLG